MRVLDKTMEPELHRSDNCKYMVCVGGYPRATMPTFAEAAARAWDLSRFEPDDDVSIYEVETGIYFDIPRSPRGDSEVCFGLPVDFGFPMD